MNAFLDSLRADLFGKRLRPLLALLALALVGAIAYAVLAGSSSSTPTAPNASTPGARGGVTVSPVKTETAEAIAETTNRAAAQTGGATRNPFTPLPQPKASTASSSSRSGSSAGTAASANAGTPESGSGSGSQPSSTTGSSHGSTSAGGSSPSKPKPTKKSPPAYEVSIAFGTAAPGTAPASAQLTPFELLTRQQPLPSAQQPLVVFGGVTSGGKSVTFTLVGEAILRGDGVCHPSTSQCQAIDLRKGQTEELEYAPPGAAATNYLLQVLDIRKAKAHGARRRAHGARARAAIVRVIPVLVLDSEPQGPSASK